MPGRSFPRYRIAWFAWMGTALLAGSLSAQVSFGLGDPSGSAGPIQATVNQTFQVKATIAGPASVAGSIQGFSMALGYDAAFVEFQSVTWKGTSLDTPSLKNGTVPGPYKFDSEVVKTGTTPIGLTLGCVFESNVTPTFFVGQGESSVAIFTFKAKALTAGTPSKLVYLSELTKSNGAVVATLYSDYVSMGTAAPTTSGVDVAIGAEAEYTIAFEKATETADTGTDITVSILLRNSPQAIDGFSLGVKHDAAALDLVDVQLGAGITSVVAPDDNFLSINKTPGGGTGFTFAIVLGPLSETSQKSLDPAASPHKVLDLKYHVNAPAQSTTKLDIVGTLGTPAVGVLMDIEGISQAPKPPATNPPPTSYQLTVSGTNPTTAPFVRGDVNQDTKVNMTDAVGIILWLFTEAPDDVKPTVANCLIALNVDGSTDGSSIETVGQIKLSDALAVINYYIKGGAPPAEPFGATCKQFAGQAETRMVCNAFTACP